MAEDAHGNDPGDPDPGAGNDPGDPDPDPGAGNGPGPGPGAADPGDPDPGDATGAGAGSPMDTDYEDEFYEGPRARARRRAQRMRFLTQVVEGDSYGTLLVVLIAYFFAYPLTDSSSGGRFLLLFLTIAVLLLAVYISRVHRATLITAIVLSVILIALRVGHDIAGSEASAGLAYVVAGLILLLAPAAVGRRVMQHRVVARETILGAICVYVMLGLLFTYLFSAVQFWSHSPFFVQIDSTDPKTGGGNFFYFSYVTLTTLGYGDLTPATEWGRSLAILEALVGQLYLATTIARLVGAVGLARRAPTHISDFEDSGAPAAQAEPD